MRKLRSFSPYIMLLLLLLVGLSSSCDRREPPLIVPPLPELPNPNQIRLITKVVASPESIYADNNITFSQIAVTVKDGEGFPATNQVVQFKSNLGRVLTNIPTDSTGVATTTFWDDGDQGEATIWAIVRNYHASVTDSIVSADTTSVLVRVLPTPAIGSVVLEDLPVETSGPFSMTVGGKIAFKARVTNSLGQNVPDNTLVTFTTNKGSYVDPENNVLGDSVVVRTINGRASVQLYAGTATGPGMISARVGTQSDTRTFVVNPGRPANIQLLGNLLINNEYVESDTSSVGSPYDIYMRARLTDMHGNYCPSQRVKFTTDLGAFTNTTNTTNQNTDINGWATTKFTPGLQAGVASITASANSDTLVTTSIFTIFSDEVHTIQWTQEEQITLSLANTGGNSSAILRVQLKDISGNLVDEAKRVSFRFLNQSVPAGANLNNTVFAPGDSLTVWSSGGEAQISVNAGDTPGVLSVKAYWYSDDGTQTVYASKPNIVIQAGSPYYLHPFIDTNSVNEGANMGGGVWRVVAGAIVNDQWGNPVERGTAVRFYVHEDYADLNVQVGADAFVGNVSIDGDSLPGVAFTTLTYNGENINDNVKIVVETIKEDGTIVSGEAILVLPFVGPARFNFYAQPSVLNFGNVSATNMTPVPAYKWAHLIGELEDGQGTPVEGEEVVLSSANGQFEYVGSEPGIEDDREHWNDPLDPPWKLTTGPDGVAVGQIRVYGVEVGIPDYNQMIPGSLVVTVTATIPNIEGGFDDADIQVWRYPLPQPPF